MRKRERSLSTRGQPTGDEIRDPQFVTALARGLDVLRAFRRGDPPLGNQEIAKRSGLPKPTVSRITYTLSTLGYLSYDLDTGKYTLSAGALALGFSALGSLGIRDIARPYMQELADDTGVSVALGMRERFTMVYVEHCRGDSPLHIGIEVGSHIKLTTTSMGRAYIAGLDPSERANVMDQIARHDEAKWPRVQEAIEIATRDYAERGFVLSLGEWKAEINSVGVPLSLGTGSLSFALNCGGSAQALPRDKLIHDVGPKLAAVAERIRARMIAT